VTTETVYQQPKILDFCITRIKTDKDKPLFGVNRILNPKETFSIVTCFLPSTLVPGKFIALSKLKTSFEESVEEICRMEEERAIDEFVNEERSLLRDERKRPWGSRTRRPFRGIIDSVKPTFRERLELAKNVVKRLGLPKTKISKRKTNRGRRATYDLSKTIPAILAKGDLSFDDLSNELININYDATLDNSGHSPGHTYLHELFQLIPLEYLQSALKLLDDMILLLYSKFNEQMNIFVGDNSALTCETLIERIIAMELRLVRETQSFFTLTRIHTNSIRHIEEATNKIQNCIIHTPQHSMILLDREFDVDDNYWVGIDNNIELHIRQKNTGRIRLPGRKKGKQAFDRRKYGKRKLGERPFGNIEKRRVKCYYKTQESRVKGCLIIGFEHNIIAWYKSKQWCNLFIELRT